MKWNGRSYRPIAPTFRVYVNNTSRPSSDSTSRPKKLPVWRSVMSVQPDTTTPVPTSSPTPTPTITPTVTQTPGASPSPTSTVTPTVTPSISVSVTPSLTPSITPSISPSVSPTLTPTNTPSVSVSVSPSLTPTNTPSITASLTPTTTPTNTPSVSVSVSPSLTPTTTPTNTPSISPTTTPTNTPSVSVSVSPSLTPTTTPTNTPSVSVSVSPSLTPTNTPSITPSISPSVSPTLTPTNTPTPTSSPIPPSPSVTATSTPTPTPTPQGVSEAQTYMSAVIAGGGTLDATSSGATYQLFYDLFNYGLWSKLYSFYPLLGGNSSGGQSVNGKTPGTRNITWNGGLTFSTNGVVSNGSTGYGNTNCNPSSIGTLDSFHMSFYSRTDQQVDLSQFDMGVLEPSAQRTQFNSRSTSDDMRGCVNTTTQGIFSNTNSSGLFTITRRSSTDTEFYRNSTSVGNSSTTSTARPNGGIFLAARQWLSVSPPIQESPTTRQYAFVTIGTTLTDSEVSNLYTTIQNFQTTLGRQV